MPGGMTSVLSSGQRTHRIWPAPAAEQRLGDVSVRPSARRRRTPDRPAPRTVSSAPGSAWATSSHWQDTTITAPQPVARARPSRIDGHASCSQRATMPGSRTVEQGDPAAELDDAGADVERAGRPSAYGSAKPEREGDAVAEEADAARRTGGRARRRGGRPAVHRPARSPAGGGGARRRGALVGRRRGRGRSRRGELLDPAEHLLGVRALGRQRRASTTRHPTSPRAPAPSHVGGTRRARTGISTRRVDRTARATDTAVATANTPTPASGSTRPHGDEHRPVDEVQRVADVAEPAQRGRRREQAHRPGAGARRR